MPQGDVQAPTVPIGLTATSVSSSQIDLSWTASTDNVAVAGYKIYRGGLSLKSAAGTSASDTGLNAGMSYCYQVSAYDAANNESYQSTVACATTNVGADIIAPTIPTGLTATAASATQIDLSWTASTDNVAVVGYRIYRGDVYLTSVAGTSTSDPGLLGSTQYCYQVSAYDAANNESFLSTVACATTNVGADIIAPIIPTNLTATAVSPTQINLSWDPSTDNVAVTEYKIYRGGAYLKSAPGTSTSDTGLNANWSYCYQVSARDAANNESYLSTVACATTQPDVEKPTAPTGLTATAVSSTQTDLSWDPSTDNVAVVGYRIYRDSVHLKSVTGTPTSDTGLPANTQYCYKVTAYDGASNESAQSTQACTPAAVVSGTTIVLQDSVSQASDLDHWTLTVSTAGTITLDVQAWESCGAKPVPRDFFGDGNGNNKLHANMYLFNSDGTVRASSTGSYSADTWNPTNGTGRYPPETPAPPGNHNTRSGQNPYINVSVPAGTYKLAIGSWPISSSTDAWNGVNNDGSDWTNSYGGSTSYNKYKINVTFN